jgi:hypothetical protein
MVSHVAAGTGYEVMRGTPAIWDIEGSSRDGSILPLIRRSILFYD